MSGNKILLTGAGFTNNLGLPLARHVWGMIFNNPKIQDTILVRNQMLDSFDYEYLYSLVLTNDLFKEERQVFYEALDIVFNRYFEDLTIEAILNPTKHNVSLHDLQSFINLFQYTSGQERYFFSINQDLFVERLFLRKGSNQMIFSPYVGNCLYNFNSGSSISLDQRHELLRKLDWKNEDGLMLNQKQLDERKKTFVLGNEIKTRRIPLYFKLHGSIGWRYTDSDEISKAPLVMGTYKTEKINIEPVLKEYIKIFSHALSKKNSYLLIYGYGFADDHINSIIVNAVLHNNLRLYIIHTKPFTQFKETIKSKIKEYKMVILSVHGYYETQLSRLFPYYDETDLKSDLIRSQTNEWFQLKANFFETEYC